MYDQSIFLPIGEQEKLRFSLPPKLRGRPTKFLTQGQGTPVATNAPRRKPHLWVRRVDSWVELLQDLFKRKNKKTKEALEPTHLATNSVEHTQQGMRFVENRSVGRVRHPQVEPKSSLPDPTTAVPKTYYRWCGAHTIMIQTVYHKFYEIFSIFTSVVASSTVQSFTTKILLYDWSSYIIIFLSVVIGRTVEWNPNEVKFKNMLWNWRWDL